MAVSDNRVMVDVSGTDRELDTQLPPRSAGRRLHPLPVRVMHWLNAIAMIVLIMSGWGVYNDSVIFHFIYFPRAVQIGSWAAEHLLWHFAAMWLLMLNGAAYLGYGFLTRRFRERLLPIRIVDVVATVRDTLQFKIAHEDLTVYNAVQKIFYIIAILAGVSQVFSGFALWKPIQLAGLVHLLGGFQSVRIIHFSGMAIIVGFLIVHVALALLVPKTLWAMLSGGPSLPQRRLEGTR